MRVGQAYISESLDKFRINYLYKFGLKDGTNVNAPIVIFGLYQDIDYDVYSNHNHRVIVVWCGSDALKINESRAKKLRERDAIHIAKSKYISDTLKRHGIKHRIIPITWQRGVVDVVPLGENIYHYGNGVDDFYGDNYIPEIERCTGVKVISTRKDMFSREELRDVYANCFIGLRMTPHDGIPNTVVELGLMGRYCIYNGSIPNAIPWRNVNDACEKIRMLHGRRSKYNLMRLAIQVKKFINIGDNWLNLKNYE